MKNYIGTDIFASYNSNIECSSVNSAGRLYFDETGMVFKPNKLESLAVNIRIEYHSIVSVSKCFGILPTGITIVTDDGTNHSLIVYGRGSVIEFLKIQKEKNLDQSNIKESYNEENCGKSSRESDSDRMLLPKKNQRSAMLLAIFLGSIGAQKFYLGDIGKGLLYLIFSWSVVPMVLSFCEAYQIYSYSTEDFERKYNCRTE